MPAECELCGNGWVEYRSKFAMSSFSGHSFPYAHQIGICNGCYRSMGRTLQQDFTPCGEGKKYYIVKFHKTQHCVYFRIPSGDFVRDLDRAEKYTYDDARNFCAGHTRVVAVPADQAADAAVLHVLKNDIKKVLK